MSNREIEKQLNNFSKDISIFNTYLGKNESVLNSMIQFENNDFRCPENKCYLIPEIKFIEDNNNIKICCECEKKHLKKLEMSQFRKNYHQSDINSVQCDNYHNKNADFFCFNCQKFECKDCNERNHKAFNSKISINDYDTNCYKHLSPFSSFCTQCKINLCRKCENEHKEHKLILLDDIKINDDTEKIIDGKIEKLKKENDSLAKNVSKVISEIKQRIDSILSKYGTIKEYFDNMIAIMNEIKNSYMRAKKNEKFNYSIKQNFKYLTEYNFNKILIDLDVKKTQIEEEIKGNKNANIVSIKTKGNNSYNAIMDERIIKEQKDKGIEENLRNKDIIKLKEKKQIYKARDRINQIGICRDGKMICVSKCGDIFIFDKEGKLLLKFEEGKQYNSMDVVDDNHFLTCSNKIEFFTYNEKENKLSLSQTEEQAFSYLKIIFVNHKIMYSCNSNNNISIWNFQKEEKKWKESQLNHDKFNVTSILRIYNNAEKQWQLISAGIFSIKFWNINENKLIPIESMKNISCCNSNSLKKLTDDLIICGGITYIYIISLINRNLVKKIDTNFRINSLLIDTDFFIAGEENGSLTIYNMKYYSIIKSIPYAHQSLVSALRKMRNDDIISGGEDGKIKIWGIN